MSDVDWLALWLEFAEATDNKQIEVAERIVYFDGRLNFTELSSSTLLTAARQIIRERVREGLRTSQALNRDNPSSASRQRKRLRRSRGNAGAKWFAMLNATANRRLTIRPSSRRFTVLRRSDEPQEDSPAP